MDNHHQAWCAEEKAARSKVPEQRSQKLPCKGPSEWVRGDPGPFGLLCFGMTTCMLMFTTIGWAEKAFLPTVFSYAFFYGGLGQFIAGTLELIKGNTFGGTAFSSYGAFWMGWYLLERLTYENRTLYTTALTGKTLWCSLWAVLTFGFFIVTLRKNGCLMTIFSSLVTTFMLLAGGAWNDKCEKAAGYIGLFCGSSAIYAAFAGLYHSELGWVLPGQRHVDLLTWRDGTVVAPVQRQPTVSALLVASRKEKV